MDEFELHTDKVKNPEYTKYVDSYQAEIKQKFDQLKAEYGKDFRLDYSGQLGGQQLEVCRNSNFEGADVKVAGIQFHDRIFGQQSQKELGYTWECNRARLDPDHPSFGLPDITIDVGAVEFFKPTNSSWGDFTNWIKNGQEEVGPYRTYEKQILITDSSGTTITRKFAMELWVTKFKVTITINANRDKPGISPSDKELSDKRYPKYWYYGNTGSELVSVNDLDRKEEYNNNLYSDIKLILEVNPNASPWYIKTQNAQTSKPKIAVAGVFCQHLSSSSLNKEDIDFNTFARKPLPLYFFPTEVTDQKLREEFSASPEEFVENMNEFNEQNIWDRPYFIRLASENIGSRNNLLAIKGQDDQIDLEFLMPLFVVGSLDVTLPSELLAEWDPPSPWARKFNLKNLLPSWGLSGIGRIISGVIIGAIVLLALIAVTPLANIISRFL